MSEDPWDNKFKKEYERRTRILRPMPKDKPYRNQKLRDLARFTPHCMNPWCKKPNDGDVVLCHSNRLEDGHGTSQKASDVPCYCCKKCHDIIDGREPGYGQQERDLIRLETTYKSVEWFLKECYK